MVICMSIYNLGHELLGQILFFSYLNVVICQIFFTLLSNIYISSFLFSSFPIMSITLAVFIRASLFGLIAFVIWGSNIYIDIHMMIFDILFSLICDELFKPLNLNFYWFVKVEIQRFFFALWKSFLGSLFLGVYLILDFSLQQLNAFLGISPSEFAYIF